VVSFWGHANSLQEASDLLGVDLTPALGDRPAIILDPDGFPTLHGFAYTECYILSPEYRSVNRPAPGEVVDLTGIAGWHLLHMTWTD
jgi:hypothetical protein